MYSNVMGKVVYVSNFWFAAPLILPTNWGELVSSLLFKSTRMNGSSLSRLVVMDELLKVLDTAACLAS